MMYTFDLTDADTGSYDIEIGVFADEQAARDAAALLLKRHTGASAVEIWDVAHRVARVERTARMG